MSAAAIASRRSFMEIDYLLGLIVSVLVFAYLLYALLWPERF